MSSPAAKKIHPDAQLLVDFVNTFDLDQGTDELADAAGIERWLRQRGIEADVAADDGEGRRRLHALREALRAVLRANNGVPANEEDLAALGDAAERCRFQVRLSDDGQLNLRPAAPDLSALEGRLLLAVEQLQCIELWPRLKACTDGSCQWAFYDTTRNRSRTWCSMEECGNREKVRRYRARK